MASLDSSSEATQTTSSLDRLMQPEWIACEILNLIFVAFVLWLLISFVVHGVRTGKWKDHPSIHMSEIYTGHIYASAVVSTCFALLRLIFDQIAFNVGFTRKSDYLCEAFIDGSAVMFSLTMIGLFLILWLKLQSMYKHVEVICTIHPVITGTKWAALVLVTVTTVICCFLFSVPVDYVGSARGCLTKQNADANHWPIYAGFAMILLCQSILIFLFLYPLRMQLSGNNSEQILKILKRLGAIAAVCTLSNLLAAVVNSFALLPAATQQVKLTVFEITMCVNILSTVLSFELWPKIVTSIFERE